jgi:hypothetical protein
MVGYLYPDEDWMTAPQEGDVPDWVMLGAPEYLPGEPDNADDEPDYDHEYRERKAEARSELDAFFGEVATQAPHL